MFWSSFATFTNVICIWIFVHSHSPYLRFWYESWRILLHYLLKKISCLSSYTQNNCWQPFFVNSISFTLIVADVDVEFHPNGKALPRKLNRIFVSKLLPSWKNADDILLEHENLRFVSLVCLILLYWWYHSIIIYATFYSDRDIRMDRFIFRTIFLKKVSSC